MDTVDLTSVSKNLTKIPLDVVKRLQRWVSYVESIGVLKTRKIPGLHDEPLKGKWKGSRSVRLGRKWRVIYKYMKNSAISVVKVEEITPHDY